MQKIEVLFRLQNLDLEIDDKSKRLQDVESDLGESAELLAAREAAASAARAAHEAELVLGEREFELGRTEEKLKEVTTALYSGKTRPAKELASLQKEVELLARVKSKAEDAQLEAMDDLEAKQKEKALTQEALRAAEAAWRQEQAELTARQAQLQGEIASLNGTRAATAQGIEPAYLSAYESLRRTRGGRAVAKVEQNVCRGCRVVLATAQVQRARTNPALTFCSSCGRILYVAH